VSILTDGPLASQRAKCRRLGVEEFCKFVVYTDEWGPQCYKPHPRGFEFLAAQMTGGGDFAFVYVGDNPTKDFGAPIALGWDTIRVRRVGGLHFHEDSLPDAHPRVELTDLTNLCDVLVPRPRCVKT